VGVPAIEPFGRSVEAIQLALPTLAGTTVHVERAARPIAVALETLGRHLVSGERLSPTQVRQIVGFVRTTLNVFATIAPGHVPAHGTSVLLEAVELVRALHRDLTQALSQHQQHTARLAPILQQLLVALREADSGAADDPAAVNHGPGTGAPNGAGGTSGAGTAAGAANSAGNAAGDANGVGGTSGAGSQAPGAGQPADVPGGPGPTSPAASLAAIVAHLAEAIAALEDAFPPDMVTHHPAETDGATGPAPRPTGKLLHTLVSTIRQLQMLVAASQMPAPLARALAQALILVAELGPSRASGAAEPAASVAHSMQTGPPAPATAAANPPLPIARLGTAIAQIVAALDGLSPSDTALSSAAPANARAIDVAAQTPRPVPDAQLAAPAAPDPHAPLTLPVLAPPAVAGVADIKAQLQALLSAATLEAAAQGAPALGKSSLQTDLAFAAAGSGSAAMLGAAVTQFDPYRWGLVAALNYRTERRRQREQTPDDGRCTVCHRLLVRTRAGVLCCPTC
jgi:hypothetical protein